jgi:hypothetical protein
MTSRSQGLAVALLLTGAVPGLAQEDRSPGRSAVKPNQLSLDIGVVQAGIGYAHRLGKGPFSLGGGLWAAYEPWNTFEQNVYAAGGGELFLRLHALEMVQIEVGPSLLRYSQDDDCSCGGSLIGGRAALMLGKGAFWVGPTVRLGVLHGGVMDRETGALWGLQGRVLFSWGS